MPLEIESIEKCLAEMNEFFGQNIDKDKEKEAAQVMLSVLRYLNSCEQSIFESMEPEKFINLTTSIRRFLNNFEWLDRDTNEEVDKFISSLLNNVAYEYCQVFADQMEIEDILSMMSNLAWLKIKQMSHKNDHQQNDLNFSVFPFLLKKLINDNQKGVSEKVVIDTLSLVVDALPSSHLICSDEDAKQALNHIFDYLVQEYSVLMKNSHTAATKELLNEFLFSLLSYTLFTIPDAKQCDSAEGAGQSGKKESLPPCGEKNSGSDVPFSISQVATPSQYKIEHFEKILKSNNLTEMPALAILAIVYANKGYNKDDHDFIKIEKIVSDLYPVENEQLGSASEDAYVEKKSGDKCALQKSPIKLPYERVQLFSASGRNSKNNQQYESGERPTKRQRTEQ